MAISPQTLLWLMVGGTLGTVARYGLALWAQTWPPAAALFPWGTFMANMVGCLGIGLFWPLMEKDWMTGTHPLYLLVAVGFLGAFTTFSTWMFQSLHLFREHHWALGALNLLGSMILGMVLVMAGYGIGSWLWGVFSVRLDG